MSERDLFNGDGIPIRTKVWSSPTAYEELDEGIRFAVRALHAAGFDTCQSCEGGEGHAYDNPTVDLLVGANDAIGFGAVSTLVGYGLPVSTVSQVWNLDKLGRPYESVWRIEFARTFPERANEPFMFVWGYQAQEI